MGKKDKTKLKTKSPTTAERKSGGDDPGVAATASGWGPGGEGMDRFGADGWGETHEQEHMQWLPPEGANDAWENGPDISAWVDHTNEEIPGLLGSGPKRHQSAAVRMSLASQSAGHGAPMPPEVADFLNRMSMTNPTAISPQSPPTELSIHRSSAAFSSNPHLARSQGPTRANSISGSHAGYPSLPNHANLQQTRFFSNRPAPLSTIHSEQSIHTFAQNGAGGVNGRPVSRQWLPGSVNGDIPMHGAHSAAYSVEPIGYMMDEEFSAEQIGMHIPEDTITFQESGGEALKPAEMALFVSPRPTEERIKWGLASEQDESVHLLLGWIEDMKHGLAQLALHKYIETRTKGALISNAQYRPAKTPDEPAFDWITFHQARGTLDRRFQEGISNYDPSTSFIVYVFLLSESGNSLGIWKRKLPIPQSLRDMFARQLEDVNEDVKRKQYVVAVEHLHPGAKTPKMTGMRHSTKSEKVTRFSPAAQPPRQRTMSTPSQPAKLTRNDSRLKKEHPSDREGKKEKKSTWSKIFGGGKSK